MLTLPPVGPGQQSLTLARLGLAFGHLPDPSTIKIIAAMADDETQTVKGYGQFDEQAFLYVVEKLFPGALKNPPTDPGLRIKMTQPKPGQPLTRSELIRLIEKALKFIISPMVKGMIVTENTYSTDGIWSSSDPDAAEAATAEVVEMDGLADDDVHTVRITIKHEDDPQPYTITLDQVE